MGAMSEDRQSHFFSWLARSVSSAQLSELYQAFTDLEDVLSSHRYLHHLTHSLVETTNAEDVDRLYNDLSANKLFMRSYRSGVKLSLIKHYARYCRENQSFFKSESHEEVISTGDVLIDRLKKDGIPYVDNRSKNGALWIAQTPQTEALLQDAKAQGISFVYSNSKQQWWTRDASPKEIRYGETIDPGIVKRNQQAFNNWLKEQGFDTLDLFSIYGTARKIHTMLLENGAVLGLFGIADVNRIRICVSSAKQEEAFVRGDKLEGRLWTKAVDSYMRFAESDFFPAAPVTDGPAPFKPIAVSSVANPVSKQIPAIDEQCDNNTIREAGFREWLTQNKPDAQADLVVNAIRNAEQYAQRTHMHGVRVFGVAPSAMQASVNHMLISRAFSKENAHLYQEFKRAAALLAEYRSSLSDTVQSQANPVSAAKMPATVEPDQRHTNEDKVMAIEPALLKLLEGEQLAILRSALISKRILTLEDFKQLNLWVFMNQNGLYSIGERQSVYSALRRALANSDVSVSETRWKIITLEREYVGATPAEALVEYCRAIASKFPLGFRSLIGQCMTRSDKVPLSRTRQHADDAYMDNPAVYVSGGTDAKAALTFARWIGKMCRDSDVPQRIDSVSPAKEDKPVVPDEGGKLTKEKGTDTDLEGQIADLSYDGDYSFTKPVSVTYKGTIALTDSWQSVYLEVCRRLFDDHMTQMFNLVNSDSDSGIAGHYANSVTKRRMRSPKAFVPGCYFESNLSATDIMRRIRRLLNYFEATNQFVIRYQSQTDIPVKKPEPIQDNPPEKPVIPDQPAIVSPLQKKVEELVLAADLEGMTLDQLYTQIPGVTMVALKQIRDHSLKLVEIADKLIHVDAFVDWDDGAQKLEEILEKLLAKNNGYVSFSQLYEYVRAEMQMFLNDNDMDDPRKVFDMAEHLFEKEGYHGKRYTFWMKTHISRSKESVTSNLDVIKKFARDHNGFFRYDELVDYLEQVGIKTGNLRGQMQLGYKPIFFYYSSEEILSAESMQIDEAWLEQAGKALGRLFADVGDHVVLRSINPIWYEQMPTLPGYLPWTPLLLQYILQFYGKKLGAKTIGSELNQKFDVLHAMLVTPDSEVQTFADAVVAHLVDNNISKRQFEAEELRGKLVNGGLIAGNELIWHMPKAIGSDPRFAWDASGGKVSIKV